MDLQVYDNYLFFFKGEKNDIIGLDVFMPGNL